MAWRQFKKEIPWLLGILALGLVSFVGFSGLQGFNDKSLDIALHDTYFVFRPFDLFCSLVSGFGLLVYGVRCLLGKLKQVAVNLMLILFTGSNLIIIAHLISAYNSFMSEWAVYPPQSYLSGIPEPMSAGFLQGIKYILITLIIVISLITTMQLRKRIVSTSKRHSA